MNILIPHSWLKDHLNTKALPEAIQANLSLCGPSVERINKVKSDSVYDIEITTNRVDAMSVRGIAREAAAILPEFGLDATLKPVDELLADVNHSKNPLELKIKNNATICKRILAIKLSIPKVEPSPQWLQDRLEKVGQRPLNNLVDITNYVMWEIGHPTHVFDFDKFTNRTLIVREAKAGESVTTLDNKTFRTVGGEVVFDDGKGIIIDMPGIMGTKNTVVDANTKNILFFVDSVKAEKIRFASMTHQIRSQAAILNEKSVDPQLGLIAIKRGVKLYQEICKAKIESELIDIYPHPTSSKPIKLHQTQLDTYLGLSVSQDRVKRILTTLGCQVEIENKSAGTIYQVTPPSFRSADITIYQDLIEEIARIYGYHNLPSIVMPTPIPDNPPTEDFELEHRLKQILSGWGASEVYTYSMVSKELALQSSYGIDEHLKIKNPLTDDWVYLRRSLLPSLAQVIDTNPNQQVTVFELQNVYHPGKKSTDLPTEELQLAVLSNHNFDHLKGLLDGLAQKLFIPSLKVIPSDIVISEPFANPAGVISADDQSLGFIGQLNFSDSFAFVINMPKLQSLAKSHPAYIPIKSQPPVIEDLTFAINQGTYLGPVMESIKNTNPLVESVTLKDQYQLPNNNQSNITFTIAYRHDERPLSDKDVLPIRKKIVSTVFKNFAAKLIGSIE